MNLKGKNTEQQMGSTWSSANTNRDHHLEEGFTAPLTMVVKNTLGKNILSIYSSYFSTVIIQVKTDCWSQLLVKAVVHGVLTILSVT